MKICVIGDIHGRNCWLDIIKREEENVDKIIFLGDYLDSFDVSLEDQFNNFEEILNYKKSNFDKIELLLGNHEFHYLNKTKNYSGHSYITYLKFNDILEDLVNNDFLKVAYKSNDVLFTHAGLSKTWCIFNDINYDNTKLDEELNILFKKNRNLFDIQVPTSGYGDETYQGPLWIRPNSLIKDSTPHLHIIGHTESKKVEYNSSYIKIDSLPYKYIIIETNSKEYEIKDVK